MIDTTVLGGPRKVCIPWSIRLWSS